MTGMHTARHTLPLLLTLTPLLVACGDATAPQTRSDFDLVLFDGRDVPASYDVGVELLDGTLRFSAGGGCLRSLTWRVDGIGNDHSSS